MDAPVGSFLSLSPLCVHVCGLCVRGVCVGCVCVRACVCSL